MNSLCTSEEQKVHLRRLLAYVQTKELTGTQAWSALSRPQATKKFKLTDGSEPSYVFSKEERETYNVLRKATSKKLFDKCGKTCSYCRRQVGNYGYGWHIEHVLPKQKYPSLTFALDNLTVGCVDCNMWKSAHVDKTVTNKTLMIINPVELKFNYTDHLRYLQLSTESLSFTKYTRVSEKGIKTYDDLRFDLLERAQLVTSVDGLAAELHDRLTCAISAGLNEPEGDELLRLLGTLRSSIYRRPTPT